MPPQPSSTISPHAPVQSGVGTQQVCIEVQASPLAHVPQETVPSQPSSAVPHSFVPHSAADGMHAWQSPLAAQVPGAHLVSSQVHMPATQDCCGWHVLPQARVPPQPSSTMPHWPAAHMVFGVQHEPW
jgi:hypothetical protein